MRAIGKFNTIAGRENPIDNSVFKKKDKKEEISNLCVSSYFLTS